MSVLTPLREALKEGMFQEEDGTFTPPNSASLTHEESIMQVENLRTLKALDTFAAKHTLIDLDDPETWPMCGGWCNAFEPRQYRHTATVDAMKPAYCHWWMWNDTAPEGNPCLRAEKGATDV